VHEAGGDVTIGGANNLTIGGGITNATGTLTIGGSVRLSGGSYAGAITNDGRLVYNSSQAQTLSGPIAGTGAVVQAGSGPLTLSVSNAFTGGLEVKAGTVTFADSYACGAPDSAIAFGDAGNQDVTLNSSGWAWFKQKINVVGNGAHTIVFNHNNSGQSQNSEKLVTLNTNSLTFRSVNNASAVRLSGASRVQAV